MSFFRELKRGEEEEELEQKITEKEYWYSVSWLVGWVLARALYVHASRLDFVSGQLQ